jgi:hypothetical protein
MGIDYGPFTKKMDIDTYNKKADRVNEVGPAKPFPDPVEPSPPQLVPLYFYDPGALVAAGKLPPHLVKPSMCPLDGCGGTLSDKPYRLEQKGGKYILPWRCRSCGNYFIMMISLNPDRLNKDLKDSTEKPESNLKYRPKPIA